MYDLGQVDQHRASAAVDALPMDPAAQRVYVRALAQEAAIYGVPAVLQYAQMYEQCLGGGGSGDPPSFNTFEHEDTTADPGFSAFRVPNVDPLYSSARLALTDGPVLLDLPEFGNRYFTLNFLDAYSNASNISARTHSGRGGIHLVASANWHGPVPEGVQLFRVATPIAWVLMRIHVRDPDDLEAVRELQRAVRIEPTAQTDHRQTQWPHVSPTGVETSWTGFFSALDAVLRHNGHPRAEEALVRRFRSIGIGREEPFDPKSLSATTQEGLQEGFTEAMYILDASRPQLGVPVSGGWTRVTDKGIHGFNYLARAVMNFVGLGANVAEENTSFNTYVDSEGSPLTGDGRTYDVHFAVPPQAEAFWSVTVYHARTGRLHSNAIRRYRIGSDTPGLRRDANGSVTIRLSNAPAKGQANWLPCPKSPFFLVLRIYLPGPDVLTGAWSPPPVVKAVLPADNHFRSGLVHGRG
jgi:hypothetical protein